RTADAAPPGPPLLGAARPRPRARGGAARALVPVGEGARAARRRSGTRAARLLRGTRGRGPRARRDAQHADQRPLALRVARLRALGGGRVGAAPARPRRAWRERRPAPALRPLPLRVP